MEHPVLDDLIGRIIGEILNRQIPNSRRLQLLARLFFGLLGTCFGLVGFFYFLFKPDYTANKPMWLSMLLVFLALSSFCLINIALARPRRWPARLFVISFASLFVTRILFGR